MNYQKKYLKYKEKYLSIKNQIGGAIKCNVHIITDTLDTLLIDLRFIDNQLPENLRRSQDPELEHIAYLTWCNKYTELNDINWFITSDSYIKTKTATDNLLWSSTVQNREIVIKNVETILNNTDVTLYIKKNKDIFKSLAIQELNKLPRFQEWIKIYQIKQREEEQRRIRRDFLVGDRVWEDGYLRPGKITSINKNGNIEMLSDDDGKVYPFENRNIHFIDKEETEEEKQRRIKDTKSFVEAKKAKEAGRAGEARQSALAVATPVRLSGTNFEPSIKGTFNPSDFSARQLRVSPDDKSEFKSDMIQNNEALDILSCDGKFLFVRSNSKEGWVKREYVTSSANIEQLVKDRWHQLGSKIKPPIIVSTDNVVTLRARPSEGSEMTDILILPDSPLELLRDHGKFFKVKTKDGREGFLRWTYIKEKDRLPPHLREVTRKAIVNRNDGQANFIKLRENPNELPNFKPVPDLPNGTNVDILEGEERNVQWSAEWEYVRYSPDRDTNVSGWVKKIYLQYL